MSDGVKLWCFLLLLPFFTVIGHDFYANYLADARGKARLEAFDIDPQSYQVSDFGYVILKHAPALHDAVRENLDPAQWDAYVDPLLRQYSFIVALAPAILFYLYLILARIIGLPPFDIGLWAKKFTRKVPETVSARERKSEPIKYTRR